MFRLRRSSFVLAVLAGFMAGAASLVAQDVTLPELPQVNGPFTLRAVTDTRDRERLSAAILKKTFKFAGNHVISCNKTAGFSSTTAREPCDQQVMAEAPEIAPALHQALGTELQ